MKCTHVTGQLILTKTITAQTSDEFIVQFKELLLESKIHCGLVYVWNTQSPISRAKGASTVVYIGKAEGSMYARYTNADIKHEAIEYWERYQYFIQQFGNIQIKIYLTSNPTRTENNFLFHYHSEHMELPPLNLQSFKRSLLV